MLHKKKKESPRRAAKKQMTLVASMINRAIRKGQCPDCGGKLQNRHGHQTCPACDQEALSVPGYATLPA